MNFLWKILPAIIAWHSAQVSALCGRKIASTERQTTATERAGCLKPLSNKKNENAYEKSGVFTGFPRLDYL
jgi:hypothetical protein